MGYVQNRSFMKSWRPAYKQGFAAAQADETAETLAETEKQTKLQELIAKQKEKTLELQTKEKHIGQITDAMSERMTSAGVEQATIDSYKSATLGMEDSDDALSEGNKILDSAIATQKQKAGFSGLKDTVAAKYAKGETLSDQEQKLLGTYISKDKTPLEEFASNWKDTKLREENPEIAAAYDASIEAENKAKVAQKGAVAAGSQKAKAQELLERDYLRVNATSDTSFDAVFEYNIEQWDKFGLKPGQYLGVPDKMLPKQWNTYKAAAEGAGIESSATTGRFLIPGARGVSLTTTFAKSASEIGNTVEGNAANTAFTKGNLFAGALSANIMDIDHDGNPIPMQDATFVLGTERIDPETGRVTGKKLSELPLNERIIAINAIKQKFVREQERHYLTQAFIRQPELLQNETVVKLTKNAPVFETAADVLEAVRTRKVMPGTLVKLRNGDLGVAR